MSRFFSEKYKDLEPYTPGEQPRDQKYIKLNTNENAYPPHPAVTEAAAAASRTLHLYSDPECLELRKTLAERLGLEEFHGRGQHGPRLESPKLDARLYHLYPAPDHLLPAGHGDHLRVQIKNHR